MRADIRFCILALLLCFSCTVKEDRDDCPCWLSLHFEDCGRTGDFCLFLRAPEFSRRDTLAVADSSCRLAVPRKPLALLAVAPASCGTEADGSLRIPEGRESPEVYLCHREVDARGEAVEDTLRFCKNFCRLSVRFSIYKTPPENLSLTVSGGVCGFDAEGRPATGDFRYLLAPDSEGRCEVCLPRQLDDSLKLEMGPKSFALGEYMAEAGYDWTAPSLDDCSITVDVALTVIYFKIDSWSASLPWNLLV